MSSFLRVFGLLLAISLPLDCMAAGPWDSPAADFANRIAAITGPGSISLSVRNASALDANQVRVVQSAVTSQLRRNGLKISDSGTATSDVRITLSQNAHGWLWIAEIQQGPEKKVAMLEVPATFRADTASRGSMSLHKQLLLTSETPILDVLRISTAAGKFLVALAPSEITVYQQNGTGWLVQQQLPLMRDSTMPRDPRGHLVVAADHLFDAYLPGTVCASSAALPLAMTCRGGDDLWPLGAQNAFFNAGRNYFTGLVRPGFAKPLSPFYAAAAVPSADRTSWILTGVDGRVRWSDGGAEQPLAGAADWGSDIASLHTGCGTGTQVLVTDRGDGTGGDSLRAFEIFNHQATISAAPSTFPGPITALRTQPDGAAATAVVHLLNRGSYEAYSIDLSCN